MAILEHPRYRPCADADDPDDYRPRSEWAAAADPGGEVVGLCALIDVVAPGDRVPLHTHPVDELIVLEEGRVEIVLGEEIRSLSAGAFIFVTAETPHGARNLGEVPARFLGVFSKPQVRIRYLERNPAPGTEGDAPQPPLDLDVRTEAER